MSQVDPIWKFCQLLDRLVVNDKRIIDCLTSLARDYPGFAHYFIENFESKFYSLQDSARKLLYMYVVDSLSFNLPFMREFMGPKLIHMYDYAYRTGEMQLKLDLEKLLDIWEAQNRFRREIVEEMRNRMAPLPPMVYSPINHEGIGIFDLGEISEWLNHHSSVPGDWVPSSEKSIRLFGRLLTNERSKIEYEQVSQKVSPVDPVDPGKLILELYDDLTKQCLICGTRFGLDSELDKHLDWHFKCNNRKGPVASWLPLPSEWVDPKLSLGILDEEEEGEKVEETVYWAPCNPDQLKCLMCAQEFDIQPYENGWVCKDAVRTLIEDQNREVVLHIACLKSIPEHHAPAEEIEVAT